MDPSQTRGRSPSATGHQQQHHHIKNSHSPSPGRPFNPSDSSSIGLGIDLDSSSSQQFGAGQEFSTFNSGGANFLDPQQTQSFAGDPSFQSFTPQLNGNDDLSPFTQQQQGVLNPQQPLPTDFQNADFTIFPPTTGEQFGAPLFAGDPGLQSLGSPDNNMASAQSHHSPTPPHLLHPEPPSAHHSPSFNQQQFIPSGRHSRNASLGPEAALLPGQEWNNNQFRTHRRSPSEYSDVSSVGGHSPNLGINDSFEHGDPSHSPMQRPQDPSIIQELHGIGSFTISDRVRSPSHSPAISPRIPPQPMPDMTQPNYTLASNGYVGAPPQSYSLQAPEAFPTLPPTSEPSQSMPQLAAPTINIDYAPPPVRSNFEGRSSMDTDALTPPDRGKFLSTASHTRVC